LQCDVPRFWFRPPLRHVIQLGDTAISRPIRRSVDGRRHLVSRSLWCSTNDHHNEELPMTATLTTSHLPAPLDDFDDAVAQVLIGNVVGVSFGPMYALVGN